MVSPVKMVLTASPVGQVIEALLAEMAATVTQDAMAGMVTVERLAQQVPGVSLEQMAPLVTLDPWALQERMEGTGETAHLVSMALQAREDQLVRQALAVLQEFQASRAPRVPEDKKVTPEALAQSAPEAILAPTALMASLAILAEMVTTEGTAGTVLPTLFVWPCRASLNFLSTVSASVPAAIWVTPTRFSPRSLPVVTLWL
jgi:hypothetical protein